MAISGIGQGLSNHFTLLRTEKTTKDPEAINHEMPPPPLDLGQCDGSGGAGIYGGESLYLLI
jgi:hypothetical protein